MDMTTDQIWNDQQPPSLDDFARLAERAFQNLPEPFRSVASDVVIRIDDFADEQTLQMMGMDDPFELSGLYHGVDIGHRDQMGLAAEPSRIFLYRRPILEEWIERGNVGLQALITHVLVHEIAHHLGLDDDEIHHIEDEA